MEFILSCTFATYIHMRLKRSDHWLLTITNVNQSITELKLPLIKLISIDRKTKREIALYWIKLKYLLSLEYMHTFVQISIRRIRINENNSGEVKYYYFSWLKEVKGKRKGEHVCKTFNGFLLVGLVPFWILT